MFVCLFGVLGVCWFVCLVFGGGGGVFVLFGFVFFRLGSLLLEPILKNNTAAFDSYYPKVITQPDQTDPSWGQVWHLPLLQLAHILNKFIMSN